MKNCKKNTKTQRAHQLSVANQFTFENVERIHEITKGEVWSPDLSYEKINLRDRSDWEMNPIEDFIIVKLYLDYKPIPQIAQLIYRTERSVGLRLRLLLHPILVYPQYVDVGDRQEDAIRAATCYLKERSDAFIAYGKQRDDERELELQQDFIDLIQDETVDW